MAPDQLQLSASIVIAEEEDDGDAADDVDVARPAGPVPGFPPAPPPADCMQLAPNSIGYSSSVAAAATSFLSLKAATYGTTNDRSSGAKTTEKRT
ncbi:uncharacterized protein G2W53_001462 [Senna tora]|uniref:Uncharacterized protein n=1 Tax=Senna tora TaxID=362788 RepID=A0A834XGC1_9FABA|nr:uncharacterized protein G2W53_001462 [Senna tora]